MTAYASLEVSDDAMRNLASGVPAMTPTKRATRWIGALLERDTEFELDLACACRIDAPVFISGFGSRAGELAMYVHGAGPRRNGPFLAVRGGPELQSPQLAQAFAGAAGGTLFVESIHELRRDLQQVVNSHLVEPAVRMIVAAPDDMIALVRSGRFDETLYYRLNHIHIARRGRPGPAVRH